MTAEQDSREPALKRLDLWLERVGTLWLLVLPILRPLIWSGEATDLPNLLYLVLLAAATATGLMLRGMRAASASRDQSPTLVGVLGLAVLVLAAIGAWRSLIAAGAWALVVMWALHLAAALALLPIMRQRPGVLLCGLVVGVLGEAGVLVGQALWERPDLQQQFLADPALVDQPQLNDQFAVRVASWRLEGSFLLANTLAAYLVTVWPLLVGAAFSAWRARADSRARLVVLVLAVVAASAAVAITGSKAGILALALAVAVTLTWLLAARTQRAMVLLALCALMACAWAVPAVRAHAVASFSVRVDYWRAGLTMIGERPLTGFGLEGFHVEYPRVKLARAEDTIIAHQEILQAATDLGIPAALLLTAWLTGLLARLRPRQGDLVVDNAAHSEPPLSWGLVGAATLLVAFSTLFVGVLHANFLAYPGGHDGWAAGWGAVVAGLVFLALAALRQVPQVPPAAYFCGVLACILHAQADFPLHSAQVVGILALVAVLGLAQRRPGGVADSPEPVPPSPRRQWTYVLCAMGVLIAVSLGVMAAAVRDEALDQGRRSEDALRRAARAQAPQTDPQVKERAREQLDDELGRHGLISDDPMTIGVFALTSALELVTESERFPRDSDLALVAAGIVIYGVELSPGSLDQLLPVAERLERDWPGHVAYAKCLADMLVRSAQREAAAHAPDAAAVGERAQRAAQMVVDLYPTCLPFREGLIRVARFNHDQATERREIDAIRALQDEVYYTSRPSHRW